VTTFVDTSVIIPLFDQTSEHHDWCRQQIETASAAGPVVVSDVVYAEVSVGMPDRQQTDDALARYAFSRSGYSDEVLYRAGRAFREYRANAGPRESLLPDFFIGALAEIEGEPLLTRDTAKVRTYFPTVRLIEPGSAA
jgi:hypothetical protein